MKVRAIIQTNDEVLIKSWTFNYDNPAQLRDFARQAENALRAGYCVTTIPVA